jgi:hypothetical protein
LKVFLVIERFTVPFTKVVFILFYPYVDLAHFKIMNFFSGPADGTMKDLLQFSARKDECPSSKKRDEARTFEQIFNRKKDDLQSLELQKA